MDKSEKVKTWMDRIEELPDEQLKFYRQEWNRLHEEHTHSILAESNRHVEQIRHLKNVLNGELELLDKQFGLNKTTSEN